MKIYVRPNRIVMVGKAWEVRLKLKEYAKSYGLVTDWISFQRADQHK